MAMYGFQCRVCGGRLTIEKPIGSDVPRPPCVCGGGLMAKDYSFTHRPGFEGGYNPTVGKYVSRPGEIRSHLSRVNDMVNARNAEPDEHGRVRDGQLSDMRPMSLHEIAARSVDGDMLDRLQREHRDSGQQTPFPKGLIDAVEKGA